MAGISTTSFASKPFVCRTCATTPTPTPSSYLLLSSRTSLPAKVRRRSVIPVMLRTNIIPGGWFSPPARSSRPSTAAAATEKGEFEDDPALDISSIRCTFQSQPFVGFDSPLEEHTLIVDNVKQAKISLTLHNQNSLSPQDPRLQPLPLHLPVVNTPLDFFVTMKTPPLILPGLQLLPRKMLAISEGLSLARSEGPPEFTQRTAALFINLL
ncbi:hypothetical protein ACLOJK_028382 [Asimina triloba]